MNQHWSKKWCKLFKTSVNDLKYYQQKMWKFVSILLYHFQSETLLLEIQSFRLLINRHSLSTFHYHEQWRDSSWILTEKMMIFHAYLHFFLHLGVKLVLYGEWCMIVVLWYKSRSLKLSLELDWCTLWQKSWFFVETNRLNCQIDKNRKIYIFERYDRLNNWKFSNEWAKSTNWLWTLWFSVF